MIVVRQGQKRSPRCKIADPVMRNVISEAITKILIARVDQQIDRMRADRATSKRVLLPRQGEPSRRTLPCRLGQDLRGQRQSGAFLLTRQRTNIFVPQPLRRNLMP